MREYKRQRGWLLTEAAVVLAVIMVLSMAIVSAAGMCRHLNWILLIRQQCLSAARAQIDSLTATGGLLDDEQVRRLWPGISVSVVFQDGREQWQGLRCCVVTASAKGRKRDIEVRLCRYFVSDREVPHERQ
jgi:hypothetical protein